MPLLMITASTVSTPMAMPRLMRDSEEEVVSGEDDFELPILMVL